MSRGSRNWPAAVILTSVHFEWPECWRTHWWCSMMWAFNFASECLEPFKERPLMESWRETHFRWCVYCLVISRRSPGRDFITSRGGGAGGQFIRQNWAGSNYAAALAIDMHQTWAAAKVTSECEQAGQTLPGFTADQLTYQVLRSS